MPQVHLVSRPAEGGIRTHLAGLLKDLPGLGWEPILHAPSSLLSSLSDDLAPHSSYELNITPNYMPYDLDIAKLFAAQISPGSLVHAHSIRAAWICSLAKLFRRFDLIITLHNTLPFVGELAMFPISALSANVICVSQTIARQVTSQKTMVIPNGVDCDIPNQHIANSHFTVLAASRLSREKGIDVLIDAAKSLKDVRFVIAGDGPMKAELESSAPSNVAFLGQRSDVYALLLNADCLVVPSRSEGQGLSALEAFAANTPVIATNVGGLPENVHNGVTGILVEPDDPGAIVNAINQLRESPMWAEQLAFAANEWVRDNRRRQAQSKRIAAVYTAVTEAD